MCVELTNDKNDMCNRRLIIVSSKNKIEVRIGGKDYKLVGVESEEYMQRVAYYIDKKMNEVMRINSRLSTAMVAVLTAINVADDYVKTHNEREQIREEALKMSQELSALKEENEEFSAEIDSLSDENTKLLIELARRETELKELRASKNIVRPVRREIG